MLSVSSSQAVFEIGQIQTAVGQTSCRETDSCGESLLAGVIRIAIVEPPIGGDIAADEKFGHIARLLKVKGRS
jgi:hypothetical protein